MAIGGACLVVVDGAPCLDGGCGLQFGEGARQQWRQRWWCGWLQGEGAFRSLSGLTGESALAAAVAAVAFGHVQVIDGAVVPKVGVPLWQDAVGVVTVDMQSQAPMTPMTHTQAMETEPLCCRVHTHHVTWTTPSDDNCRRAVDST
jgi:hypothetical protein